MSTAHKVRKQLILDPAKIRKVRQALQAKTDTEAVDKAMDMVLGDAKIWNTMESLRGKVKIEDIYGRLKSR